MCLKQQSDWYFVLDLHCGLAREQSFVLSSEKTENAETKDAPTKRSN